MDIDFESPGSPSHITSLPTGKRPSHSHWISTLTDVSTKGAEESAIAFSINVCRYSSTLSLSSQIDLLAERCHGIHKIDLCHIRRIWVVDVVKRATRLQKAECVAAWSPPNPSTTKMDAAA